MKFIRVTEDSGHEALIDVDWIKGIHRVPENVRWWRRIMDVRFFRWEISTYQDVHVAYVTETEAKRVMDVLESLE
jgi:hypothetical protein